MMTLPDELEAAVTAARARVRLAFPWWLRPVLARGVVGITLGRRIYVGAGVAAGRLEDLLWHELTHVRQINRLGVCRFYWSYVREFVRNRRQGMSAPEAYRNISFELEANAVEEARAGRTYNQGSAC